MGNSITMSVNGQATIIKNVAEFTKELGMQVSDIILGGANQCFADSQDTCPVDTGDLKASGYIHTQEGLIEVGYGTGLPDDRAWYCELGTIKQAAQPYLGPAFENACQQIGAGLNGLL